ncbi:YrhC family protein [Virgibacillus ndiopensis]|uniref:YrhC family protein n=1 Tax=Virgibacillus ndiopensis TaxID=2004408 RepID=UPI00159BB42A|nr:YrhC family protein [Virgibacillus ndiopensis]
MMNKRKELELKLKDYKRFMITLLLLSIYLYLGAVIDTYIQPTNDGDFLFNLSFGMTVIVSLFGLRFRRLKAKLEERV